MVLEIDGTDITPYIFTGGIKWQRSDVDNQEAGRTMDGVLHRGRVATKIRLDITCRPLDNDEIRTVLNLILPEWVTVRYYDPMQGLVTKTMYSNNHPASYLLPRRDGRELWHGVTFPLIEQ